MPMYPRDLAQRVSALEAKLACVTRAPVNEFPG